TRWGNSAGEGLGGGEDSSLFGMNLVGHRRRLGLSQEARARRASIAVKTLRSIEYGRTVPRPSTVRQLADALGLTGADRERFCAAAAPDPAEPPTHPVPGPPHPVPGPPHPVPGPPHPVPGRSPALPRTVPAPPPPDA